MPSFGSVVGVATSGRAARELAAGAGIPTWTISKFLYDTHHQLTNRHVLIVDEAGMVNSRDLDHVLTAARDAGAKIVLVGDHHQLPEVGAGGGFAHAVTHATSVSELTLNRRQVEPWERDALVELRHGDIPTAWNAYRTHDRVVITDTHTDARTRAVTNWWDQYSTGTNSVLLAGTRAEVTELNRLARLRVAKDQPDLASAHAAEVQHCSCPGVGAGFGYRHPIRAQRVTVQ